MWEVKGTQAERVKAVTQILAVQEPLPSPLQDAFYAEQQLGDGNLGPSDYVSFGMVRVRPSDLLAWQRKLIPLKIQPDYAAPQPKKPWWVNASDYSTLEFYQLQPYTNRLQGWIGIDLQTKQIYIYTSTT
ncbi:MAG: hypothetical protein HC851_11150 [Acaryochloris sp. RU_4_1]|nr:hypothetical protein [Acaryochloris sp. RU_4_1]NJR54788.1 hypothetical protein [Acaryochloris sp. CRU_2_0]